MVGSGNVAWHLAPELENAGHRVSVVYSRNVQNAKALQKRLYNAEVCTGLDFNECTAEVFVVAVADDAVAGITKHISLPREAVLLHTSGSLPISALGYAASTACGVLYPLQTFTKSKRISFEDIPMLIEAEEKQTARILSDIASSISKRVYQVHYKDRLAIHVAAVFACNFSNKMMTIAQEILQEQKFDFDMLRPLIAETINKSLDIGPKVAQTGPASRGDLETLDRHMDFLQRSPYRELYKEISQKILESR
ncbi:MAG: DUF2520 domain-containing protein [Cyclobacteriaceae bacterium]|nr:DUF2520 domain-containing protein [Cyclobacteriaceae bacterium]